MKGSAQDREGTPGPPVDLIREADALVLMVSLPGLGAQDFRVSLLGDRQVRIEGTAPYRHPVPPDSLLLAERRYGPFARSVALPMPVDASGVSIGLAGGVLTARLPLRMQPLPLTWESGAGGDGVAQPG